MDKSDFKIIAWPVEPPVIVNQKWGNAPEKYQEFGWSGGHEGIDLTAPLGVPIFAVAEGTIRFCSDKRQNGTPSAYGLRVEIEHANGYRTLYAHLRSDAAAISQPGTEVAAGQMIGFSGNTGNSTGPHLHFSLKHADARTPGFPATYIDPTPYFEAAFNSLIKSCSQMRTPIIDKWRLIS
ncbi:MAG: M23 family metallopeptidase [Anaerolineales bacterium]|nr:M23 family metallopeptidase [Anaerolineales bacterium]